LGQLNYKYLLVEGLLKKDDPTDGFDPLFVTGEEQLTELAPGYNVFITWIAESFLVYFCSEAEYKMQKNL
jgi:hypothetical protein